MADGPLVPPPLVLASASPRRLALLARLGLAPVVRPADVDETPRSGEDATALAVRLSDAKAAMSAQEGHDEVVLAADTVVVLDGRAVGKPVDPADAVAMLTVLSGRTHEVRTAVVVRRSGDQHLDVIATRVTFRELTDAEVAWYVATGEPADKAGAYGLQGAGAALVTRVEGSDTNVIGLPLAETVALLRRVGLDPLAPAAHGRRTPTR